MIWAGRDLKIIFHSAAEGIYATLMQEHFINVNFNWGYVKHFSFLIISSSSCMYAYSVFTYFLKLVMN